MKSQNKSRTNSKLEFVLGNSDSIFDKGTVNPAFKVMEEIYSNGKISFFDRINRVSEPVFPDVKQRPNSLTPVPHQHFRELSKSKNKKEDIFINPAAFYLSRKPIAFKKDSREAMRQKSLCSPLPKAKATHKKSKSQQVPSNLNLISKDTSLLPIEEIKEVSPRTNHIQQLHAKEISCQALSKLSNYCEETLKVKTPLIGKQQKVAQKYSREMDWITEVLQNYGEYKPKIMKELFRYTADSRDDLEAEREKIVNQIKSGAFDPNKNVVRLRARLKKKKDKNI